MKTGTEDSSRPRFQCSSCNEWHEGIPGWGWIYPPQVDEIPESEREDRCFLTSELCVIDGSEHYVLGCLEIPVIGYSDLLSFRVWVALSPEDYREFEELIEVSHRSNRGPYLGRLAVPVPSYSGAMGLGVQVHLRDDGIRPYIELEPTDHPVSVEQRHGTSLQRIQAVYSFMERLKDL